MVLVDFTCGKQGCEFSCLRALGVGNTWPATNTTQDKKGVGQSSANPFHWSLLFQVSILVFFPSGRNNQPIGLFIPRRQR
jgi:hypothetical protein